MKIFLIGVGGAGNKAAITAIEKGIVTKQDTVLLNTTISDIPEDFRDIAIKFGDSKGGCGKERHKARGYMIDALQNELKDIDVVDREDIELVVITTSTEGGTGSGSTLILSKYINQVLGKDVQIFAFTGFEEDGRGLKNTIGFFQEIDPEVSVQCISNSKFLRDTSNKVYAEKLSNESFCLRLKALTGLNLVESAQNIDATDLFKVSTQPGYTVCGQIDLPKVKNMDMFNKIVREFLDNDESLDTTKTVKRLAVMYDVNEDTLDNIDFGLSRFKEHFGNPFEVYTHIQNTGVKETMYFIASGLELPLDEVKEVYARYEKQSNLVNKKKDIFHDEASELNLHHSDEMFDLDSKAPTKSKADFFSNIVGSETVNKPSGNDNYKVKIVKKEVHNEL